MPLELALPELLEPLPPLLLVPPLLEDGESPPLLLVPSEVIGASSFPVPS